MSLRTLLSTDRLEAAQRHSEAFRLRLAGHDFAEIAEQLGYADKSGAYRAISAELERRVGKPADELRQLEMARLDALWQPLFERFQNSLMDEDGPDLKLVDRLGRIVELRAKISGLMSFKILPQADALAQPAAPVDKAAALVELYDRLKARLALEQIPAITEVIEPEQKG